ncbi:MAG: hypothetical protein GXO99_01385 [Nitrospirae bacterium]|nr:hypothetical protein [Nitrospirota bacterium]
MVSITRTILFSLLMFGLFASTYEVEAKVDCGEQLLSIAKKEKARGNIKKAFLFYMSYLEIGLETFCPFTSVQKKALVSYRKTGKILGQEAEKKGQVYPSKGERLLLKKSDKSCTDISSYSKYIAKDTSGKTIICEKNNRLYLNPLASAFTYYENSLNYQDVDRLVFLNAKNNSKNYRIVEKAFNHFADRKEFTPPYTPTITYKYNPQYLSQLKDLVHQNLKRLLKKEKTDFSMFKKNLESSPEDTLKEVGRWAMFLGKKQQLQIRKIALKRGQSLSRELSPRSLEKSLTYFEMAGNSSGITVVKKKAHRLGEKSLKEENPSLAARYFYISGETDRATKIKEEALKSEKVLKQKDTGEFKNEADELEKDLGL